MLLFRQRQFGQELKAIKEISHLQDRLHEVLNPVQSPPPPTDPSLVTKSAKDRNNCRGLQNSSPYLHQLITDGSDIIGTNEHLLWPYQLPSLRDINPDFNGYGYI
jgi:hypothetical protein